MQGSRRIQALGLVLILACGTIAAPASAQADDPKQPSVENPHMHFWGTSQLDSCWTHFDANDSAGSAPEGYGTKTFPENAQVEVDYTCRIQSGETFKQDMYLNENGTINIEMSFKIFSQDCDEQNECKDLTITLYRGTIEVAMFTKAVETVNNYEDFTISWNIPVNETMYRWNKSGEEPAIRVEYSAPNPSSLICLIPGTDCTGEFMMYYSNNEENYSVEANFPVINSSDAGPGDGGGDGGIGGAVDDALPGFGLAAGLAALAMAAIGASRFERKE